MKAKELIKEIDPDYIRCTICNRFRHKDNLVKTTFYSSDKIIYQCKRSTGCNIPIR